MIKVDKKNIYENIGLVLLKICLDLVYVFFICDEYGYGLHFKIDFSTWRFLESWTMYLTLVVFTPRKKNVTAYFLLMQLVITIAPMLTIYGLYNRSRYFMYLICAAHLAQCVVCKVVRYSFPARRLVQGRITNESIVFLVTGITIVLTLTGYGVPSLQALDFSKVYEVRSQNELSGVLGYLVPWYFYVILPYVIVDSLQKKKKTKIIFFMLVALFLYLTYAHKSWLLATFFIIAVYVAIKYNLFVKGICIGVPLLIAGITGFYEVVDKWIMLPSVFVRRLFFVPANIKFEYYAFFSKNPKLFFSEGQIGNLFGIYSPYEEKVSYIIGEQLGEKGASCNTGYLADGYANLGVAGVFLMAIILVLILKTIDGVSRKESFIVNFSMLSYVLFSLNDGALLTRLLTGGMFLIILMIVIRKDNGEKIIV